MSSGGIARTYRRLRYGVPIVVVTGLPRSGTSMTMRMLAHGGIELVTDVARVADEENPYGYFEDVRATTLHRPGTGGWLAHARGRAVKIISFLLRSLPPSNNYQVLFVRRDLREVAESQDQMLARRGQPRIPVDLLVASLEREVADTHLILRRPQFRSLEVRYRDTLDDPMAQAERVTTFLGRRLDVAKMAQAVDRTLYRHRA